MTALAVEAETRLFEPSEVTLEDTILGAWEALAAQRPGPVPGVSRRAGARRLCQPAAPQLS